MCWAIDNQRDDTTCHLVGTQHVQDSGSVGIVDELIERGLLSQLRERERSDLQALFRSVLASRDRPPVEKYPSMVARAWLQSNHGFADHVGNISQEDCSGITMLVTVMQNFNMLRD